MHIVLKSVVFSLAALLAPLASHAEGINTWAWQTGNNSNWVTAGNWNLGHAPTNGEIALISNAKVELTNDTADLGGLIVTNGAILSVYSPLTNGSTAWGLLVSVSGTVSIAGSAWIYPYSQNTNGGSAWFRCTSLVVGTNSGFDANSKGFAGGINAFGGYNDKGYRGAYANENGVNNPPGYGPGRSLGGTYGGAGAGYGGRGGFGSSINNGNEYGSYIDPTDPGSGAGGAATHSGGGSGGGLIRIIASDSVLMDGSLLANGQDTASYAASGSGGGICVSCRTFEGTGTLSAIGGNDLQGWYNRGGGGGGGGRIAVVYDSDAQAALSVQPTVVFNATGGGKKTGATWYNGSWVTYGGVPMTRNFQARPGSLYLTDNRFFDLGRIQGGKIVVPGVTSWSMNTFSNSQGLIAFPANFTLTVTQDVVMTGAGGIDFSNSMVTIGGNLIVNSDRRGSVYFRGGPDQQVGIGSNINVTMGWVEVNQQGMGDNFLDLPGSIALNDGAFYLNPNVFPTNPTVFNVGGGISLTNSAMAFIYSGVTNGSTSYGLLLDVEGNLTLAPNSWVYPYSHYTNGGSVHFRAANLSVATNAGFDASAKGFSGGLVSYGKGFGPSQSPGGTAGCTAGAGYGGRGGSNVSSSTGPGVHTGGATYGSSNAPVDPGSGGGASQGALYGTYGGGLIHVVAEGSVIVDGSLLADGESRNGYGGVGSGGGIFVNCKEFKGANTGILSAKGATNKGGQAPTGSGGSGGGRIAVWYSKPLSSWSGAALVDGGLGKYTGLYQEGANGTVVFLQKPPKGTMIIVN